MDAKVLLLRHGMTQGNLERRYVGSTDEPLADFWRLRLSARQRARNADAFYERIGNISAVYSSPLRRCLETAELLFPAKRFPGIRVHIDRGLAECGFGDFEYKNYQELDGNPEYQAFLDSGGTDGFPGGERVADFKRRSAAAFEKIVLGEILAESAPDGGRWKPGERSAPDGGALVFLVHGGTIMAVMERFAKPGRDYFSWQVGCGGGFLCTARMEDRALSLVNVAKISVL